ncbi:MAG TPA: response regulator [Vicinamibacterales bacterium]|nr:response regulator [Vicinamibacterales bacterium]
MSALILLVESDRTVLGRTEALLTTAGHLVAAVSTYHDAKHLMDSVSPDMLIVGVRLDAFNGMHLAVRCRREYPLPPVMITSPGPDAVVAMEAERIGAIFFVDPANNPEFLPRVAAALAEHRRTQPTIRRWPRKQVPGMLEAELEQAPARVFDVSYGGLRLAFDAKRTLPEQFDITLRERGVTVKARPVWTYVSPSTNEFWCGAELVDNDNDPITMDWRALVDAT